MLDYLRERVLYESQTELGYYQVVERIYSRRPARVLYSGKMKTGQSGIALDNDSTMLFGYNQRFMEIIEQLKPKTILLIGGGAYTLPTAIMSLSIHPQIDVVEPNKDLVAIASQFFNYRPGSKMTLFHLDGLNFLKSNNKRYDLIIVDAYSDDHIPSDIISEDFAKKLKQALSPSGVMAMNVISDLRPNSSLKTVQQNFSATLGQLLVYPADSSELSYYYDQNFILISGRKNGFDLKYPPLARSYDF